MSYRKIMLFLIIICIGKFDRKVVAQPLIITGDTIFVNTETRIQINFPSLVKEFSIVPGNAPYYLKNVGTGVNIIARSENARPATLLVSEAGRHHRFIILFKKDINYSNDSELFYDYSTQNKLEQHIRMTALRKSAGSEKLTSNTTSAAKPADGFSDYYGLLEQGEKYLKDQNLIAAKSAFDRAHLLRPDDLIPIQMLEDIKVKQAMKRESTQTYSMVIAGAINNLNQKKYKEAQQGYRLALDLKPGDLYVTQQLETIDKFLQEENERKDPPKPEDLYNEYISRGQKAFNNGQLTDARTAYEKALVIRQNDALATKSLKLIDEKEKLQKKSEELENNYKTAIQAADKLYGEGDLNNAKTAYNNANSIFKRSYPQEQVKKIEKLLAEQVLKENIEKQQLAEQLAAEKKKKERLALEDKYDAAIQLADNYYKKGDYDSAKIEYNKALGFVEEDRPKNKIKEIDKIIAEKVARENKEKEERRKKEIETKYNNTMRSADKFFLAGDYVNARIEYNKAISITPNPLPLEQIKKINKILADQLAEANAERQRREQEAEITSKYLAIIKNAEIEFHKKNYLKAKKLYTDAASLRPAEEYPKERLVVIENNFAQSTSGLKANNTSVPPPAAIDKKYNQALSTGKSYYQNNDLLNARIFYEEAAKLMPSEDEPKKQLNIITDSLAELARINEIDSIYENKIIIADSQLVAKAYESAIITYKEALVINPLKSYPLSQIKYIQSELIKIAELNKRQEDERRYRNALASAEKAVADKRYRDAKSAYIEALTIQNSEYARSRLKIVSYQVERTRTDKPNQLPDKPDETPPLPKPRKRSKKDKEIANPDSLVFQASPIPYSNEELVRRYPGVSFSTFPPEQSFNKSLIYSKENLHTYDSMLLEKPRLDLSSTDQGVKLICQGINFGETIVYIKLLVQNYSNTDFLTGPMMLTWDKKAENPVKLAPYYLYPSTLPVIKPLSEAIIVYVCKSYDILDEEMLRFELTDRFNKVKLQVKIPGSVYNREWAK